MNHMNCSWEIFENIDEIIYVADPETHELVYMNRKGQEAFGCASIEEARGETCFRTLQNCSEPCELCNEEGERYRQRRYYNPKLGRYLLCKDTLIIRDGRRYCIGIALDVSAQERQGSMVRGVQNVEATLNEGLRLALQEDTPDQSLEVLLAHLGKALGGERTYIFERSENLYDHNTYEWVAEGIRPEKENLQNVPPEVCANWYRMFRTSSYVTIPDLEAIREKEPLLYQTLRNQDIHSLMVVPLYDDGKILGFYGVDNPPEESHEYTSNMLQITAHFIVSALRRRNLMRKLEDRSRDVFYALNVDYLGIYQVNFDTDECITYRASERLRKEELIHFEDGYEASMDRYIRWYVIPQDQERIRAVTRKDYVLAQLRTKKKFFARYQVTNNNLLGAKNIEIHFSAVGQEGEENRAFFAFRDVNSLVAQEEEYREETRRNMEDVLEGSRTGIWTIELEENCPPRMTADRTMRMLLGIDETVGPEECYQRWFRNIDPAYVEAVEGCVEEIVREGRSEVVYPWEHPVYGKIYVRCGGNVDKKYDKPGIRIHGYHQDITETTVTRKNQEQAIMELLEKVRQANMSKSEFLSRMSHDLRTPINGILGMLTIMESTQDDPAKQKECREKLRISAEHLMSLVNDVLEVSKLESGRAAEVEEPFELHRILTDCVKILSSQAEAAGVEVSIDETGVTHNRLIGNPLQLKQIIVNILENAVKYNVPNGTVWIRVTEGPREGDKAEFRIAVQDTGIGIGEDFLPHVFEPFSQENYGARTDYRGVGLGMPIARKIANQAGGEIEVESRRGEGSTFLLTLPLQINTLRDIGSVINSEEGETDISGMKVLLVEDNAINREIVEFILNQAGAKVVSAQDGQVAVDTFKESPPWTFDCVLMDLMMPVMSGYEATRVIRALDRADATVIPIIALSANAFEEDGAMSRAAGMDEHLAKPVDIDKLFRTMTRLCSR